MQLSKKFKFCSIITASILLLVWFLNMYIGIRADEKTIVYMLNILKTPNSLKEPECESWGFTDILETCYIEISPKEFPLLLKGYTYQESPQFSNSHEVVRGQKLGPTFPVSKQYIAEPSEFKHGGFVSIYTNTEMNKAILDLYIE